MTSRESYGIAKAIINQFLENLATNASGAASFFSHDASFIIKINQEQPVELTGKHSIFNFLHKLPLFTYEVFSYDVHTITLEGISLTALIITGKLKFFAKQVEPDPLHISAHVQEIDGRAAIIKTMTFKVGH